MMRLGILGSTRGTNLLAIDAAIKAKRLAAEIAIVISNKPDAILLSRANALQLPTCFINPVGLTRSAYDDEVSKVLKSYDVDLIVLIGYMRILSAEFVAVWQSRIINVHPSLLPAYAGLMDLQVHQAILAAHEQQTGCTVHYVTADVDAGPILVQQTCPVFADDTPEILKARVQALEGEALVEAIEAIGCQ